MTYTMTQEQLDGLLKEITALDDIIVRIEFSCQPKDVLEALLGLKIIRARLSYLEGDIYAQVEGQNS